MLSLIWKEFRERLPWAVALCMISAYSACTRGYTFYGSPDAKTLSWSIGPILIAFLMGASAYSSELTDRRSLFIITRPINWLELLISKLICNAGALLAASVIAAIAYRVTCPAAYISVATTARLVSGIGYAFTITGAIFLIGFGCSSVVSGAAEAAVFAAAQGAALLYIFSFGLTRYNVWWWQVMLALWPLPMVAAGVIVARSSLALPTPVRLRKYGIAGAVGLVILGGLVFLTPDALISKIVRTRTSDENITWSISPDGNYALGRDARRIYWLDIRNDRLTRLEAIYDDYSATRVTLEDISWVAPHTAYRIGYLPNTWFIRTYSGPSHNDIASTPLSPVKGYPSELQRSPSGRYAAISLSTAMDSPLKVIFVDVITGRKLPLSIIRPAGSRTWWRSDDIFCFDDKNEVVHRISLPGHPKSLL